MTTIYKRLESDHDDLKRLMDALVETEGDSEKRTGLFKVFKSKLEAHSHAEERSLYASILSKKATREKTAHGTKEHCEASDLLEDLEKTEQSSSAWLQTMKKLREEVVHHIEEEEGELFTKAKEVLSNDEATRLGDKFAKLYEEETQ